MTMITFLTGLTIGFIAGFLTAFIWEHSWGIAHYFSLAATLLLDSGSFWFFQFELFLGQYPSCLAPFCSPSLDRFYPSDTEPTRCLGMLRAGRPSVKTLTNQELLMQIYPLFGYQIPQEKPQLFGIAASHLPTLSRYSSCLNNPVEYCFPLSRSSRGTDARYQIRDDAKILFSNTSLVAASDDIIGVLYSECRLRCKRILLLPPHQFIPLRRKGCQGCQNPKKEGLQCHHQARTSS